MKSDSERGQFGTWLRRVRSDRFRNVPEAVQAVQHEAGYGIAPSVWAELESGTRRPSKEQRERLTRFFGTEPVEPEGDLSALVAAIAAQTRALDSLVAELRRRTPAGDLAAEAVAAGTLDGERAVEMAEDPPGAELAPAQRGRR